jgi:hypothetical protein
MANEKNLVPFTSDQSHEEAVKNGRKGGKRSGEVKREQKTYREMAKAMLSAQVTDKAMLDELAKYGISDTDLKAVTLLGMIKASAEGSHNAFDRLLDLVGENIPESTNEEKQQRELLTAIEKAVKDAD